MVGQLASNFELGAKFRDQRCRSAFARFSVSRSAGSKRLEILVGPLTEAPLRCDREAQELISEEVGLAYPIRDSISIMPVDVAPRLRDDEMPAEPSPLA
jgi:hypothetical protein